MQEDRSASLAPPATRASHAHLVSFALEGERMLFPVQRGNGIMTATR
jgi:hypothetical protein